MRPPPIPPDVRKALAAAAVALATFAGLSWVGRAPDQGQRLQALEQTAARLVSAPAADSGLRNRPNLCRTPLAEAASDVEDQVRIDAAASGSTIETFKVSPGAAGTPTDLAAAEFEIGLSGDEAAITRFLKVSVDRRAPIFLRHAEVSVAPEGVRLRMLGRLLCRR